MWDFAKAAEFAVRVFVDRALSDCTLNSCTYFRVCVSTGESMHEYITDRQTKRQREIETGESKSGEYA